VTGRPAGAAPVPPSAPPLDPSLLALAGRLADASGAVIRRHFRTAVAVDDKPDASPVTVADRDAESAIRAILAAERPQDGVVGEEHGADRPDAEHVWVIDPIDGTKAFITGRPTFGTIVALLRRGEPVLGVIDQPIVGDRWVGAAGRGTTHNGAPVRTRACPSLSLASIATTGPDLLGDGLAAYQRAASAAKVRVWGGDCYNYGLVASGFLDVVVEAGLKLHDWAGLVPVVTGAGGSMTDWDGRPLRMGSDGRVAACGDARCHADVLARLSG
jgi:inositol-phosphate phosphatase/L-galactose 1-phosphate phosphatase/histidinol-phosphatase